MHGNRDFLLGEAYAQRAGMRLLEDPTRIELNGKPVLLMHGDTLCTDDVAYKQFREQTRHPEWQAQFLSQPLAATLAFANRAHTQRPARPGRLAGAGAREGIQQAWRGQGGVRVVREAPED